MSAAPASDLFGSGDAAASPELRCDRDRHASIDALIRALRADGLAVQAHGDPSLESDRVLWIDCRAWRAELDARLVYSVLSDGWSPDVTRLRRRPRRYDAQRLRHVETGATVTVVICLPQLPVPDAA